MAKIDTDKFIAKLVEKHSKIHNYDRTIIKSWLDVVLEEMGFEVVNGEIVEIKKEEPNQYNILDFDVINFNLSIRTQNILKQNGTKTMRDLVRLKRIDYLKFRGSGRVTLANIDDLLENINLNWGMDV